MFRLVVLLAAVFASGALAQSIPPTNLANFSSTCPTGYSATSTVFNETIPNASLVDVWKYFAQWNNKTWTNDEYVISADGMEPGTLRNTTFNDPNSKPLSQEILFRLGTDSSNVPFASFAALGFRNIDDAGGNGVNNFQIWYANQLAAENVNNTNTAAALNATSGVVVGLAMYGCAPPTGDMANGGNGTKGQTQQEQFQNIYTFFSGGGANKQAFADFPVVTYGHPYVNGSLSANSSSSTSSSAAPSSASASVIASAKPSTGPRRFARERV